MGPWPIYYDCIVASTVFGPWPWWHTPSMLTAEWRGTRQLSVPGPCPSEVAIQTFQKPKSLGLAITSICPEIETSSFDWAHQSRYPSPVTWWRRQIPVSETSCILIIRRWIMSMKFVILANHRHKPSEYNITACHDWTCPLTDLTIKVYVTRSVLCEFSAQSLWPNVFSAYTGPTAPPCVSRK
jgi:hypothetical protein